LNVGRHFMRNIVILTISILFSFSVVGQSTNETKFTLPGFVQINDTLFISTCETSIRDYAKFLLNLVQLNKDTSKLQLCIPNPNYTDWTMWSSFSKKLLTYDDNIFTIIDTSISFTSWLGNYPVVNVDKIQALEYCKFKTEEYKIFFNRLTQKQRRKFPEKVLFRLPTAKEWTEIANTPLENPNIICKDYFKSDLTGQSMPMQINKGSINSFGIYNMTGNVAELVIDANNVYGGSFKETIDNCNSTSFREFIKGDNATGFRIIAIIK